MSGFVVYRDASTWFHWTPAEQWAQYVTNPYLHILRREKIGEYPTKAEAREVRDLYNQMVHGRPSNNELYNKALRERNTQND